MPPNSKLAWWYGTRGASLAVYQPQVCNLTYQKSLFLIIGPLLCYLITKFKNSKTSTTFMFSKGPAHCRKIGLSLAAQNTKPCALASSIAKAGFLVWTSATPAVLELSEIESRVDKKKGETQKNSSQIISSTCSTKIVKLTWLKAKCLSFYWPNT